jgi:hypothetical protein
LPGTGRARGWGGNGKLVLFNEYSIPVSEEGKVLEVKNYNVINALKTTE